MTKTVLAAAAALVIGSAAADAATWKFSYTFTPSGAVATGTFEGDLQGDGNTIFVTGTAADLALNGTPYSQVIDQFYAVSGPIAFMNLDGTDADVAFAPTPSSSSFFLDFGGFGAGYSDPGALSASDGGVGSLVVSAAVPLPAALPMLLAGLGGLFAVRRRSA